MHELAVLNFSRASSYSTHNDALGICVVTDMYVLMRNTVTVVMIGHCWEEAKERACCGRFCQQSHVV